MGAWVTRKPGRTSAPRRRGWACPRHFDGLPYGPMQLRPLLRQRLERGERLIGWGLAVDEPNAERALMAAALSFVPGVGQALAIVLGVAAGKRLMVLTDRRLLLLKVDRSGPRADGRGVLSDRRLTEVRVVAEAPRRRSSAPPHDEDPGEELEPPERFGLVAPGQRALRVIIQPGNSSPARRLREGLFTLWLGSSGSVEPEPAGRSSGPARR